MFPKKQEPTNREASQVIGRWIAPLPCWADMLRVRRRCAQTAHISLQISCFQRAKTQNNRTANSLARPAALYPEYFCLSFRFGAPSSASALLRRVVFGEAVFTDGRVTPQEEKTHQASFFCHTPCLKAFSAVATHCQAVGRPDLARVGRAKVA